MLPYFPLVSQLEIPIVNRWTGLLTINIVSMLCRQSRAVTDLTMSSPADAKINNRAAQHSDTPARLFRFP
ncbi:hypothetical protein PoB_006973400 [Plakobranchus ocellatus]|uniref:Uncharacterized protein n=1 Tax=Plakobranchus ocellatus TaxID=259542 RepID=A0AAV4DGT0_9GAST|nr:hypothetical protein PoB_006973400 [Plakobranchus ocellatus]